MTIVRYPPLISAKKCEKHWHVLADFNYEVKIFAEIFWHLGVKNGQIFLYTHVRKMFYFFNWKVDCQNCSQKIVDLNT